MERRKALAARKPIAHMSAKRAATWTAAGRKPGSTLTRLPAKLAAGPWRVKAAEVTPVVAELVFARDRGCCVSCGVFAGGNYSKQHRVARGAGGTSRTELGQPANIVLLCGSATTGCHGRVEGRRSGDKVKGYWMPRDHDGRPTDPAVVPLHHAVHGWVLLDNDGGWTACQAVA